MGRGGDAGDDSEPLAFRDRVGAADAFAGADAAPQESAAGEQRSRGGLDGLGTAAAYPDRRRHTTADAATLGFSDPVGAKERIEALQAGGEYDRVEQAL